MITTGNKNKPHYPEIKTRETNKNSYIDIVEHTNLCRWGHIRMIYKVD